MPLVGRHDLARLFEHTESYIHTLVKEGMPQASRGKYEVGTCLLWYIKHLKKKLKGRRAMSDEDTTERTARLRLVTAEAELRELELSRERREFAAAAHFDKMLNYVFVTATTRFLSLPSRIAPQLVGEDRLIIESRLERELKGALSSLSRNGFKNARKLVRREAMDVTEKATQAILKAEKYELYPGFDSGLMLLYDKLDDEPELREAAVAQLLKCAEQVRPILEGRACSARASELIGQPCWQYVDGEGTVTGTVDSVDQGNGKVYILRPVGSHGGQTRVMADTKRLFILARKKSAATTEHAAETVAIPANVEAGAERAPRGRLREILDNFGGGREK